MTSSENTDGFAEMFVAARNFFLELSENNNKDWFEPRKSYYQKTILKPAELLSELMAEDLSRLTGAAFTSKVFRIYRDVRFSKDKSPYNTHLHVLWSQGGEMPSPGWFFALSPQYFQFAAGVIALKGEALNRYRAMIDRRGDEFANSIAAVPPASLGSMGAEPLKRVPKPYPPDHPHADLLKRKDSVLSMPLDLSDMRQDSIAALTAAARALLPFWTILNEELAGP